MKRQKTLNLTNITLEIPYRLNQKKWNPPTWVYKKIHTYWFNLDLTQKTLVFTEFKFYPTLKCINNINIT